MHLSRKKKILVVIGFLLAMVVAWQRELVGYGLAQGYGQFKILCIAKPVYTILEDPSVADSIKQKILIIQQIKKFAVDSLGLAPSGSYATLYDQENKPIVWVLTVCDPYRLEPYQWHFPFLGRVSYKGFFSKQSAEKEEQYFKRKGYDTDIGEANAWSTLGWFNDPILSSMLKKSEGSLADLIIHELTHGTIYLKDSVEYNENLASFVGHRGALAFLKYKYGENSTQYSGYVKSSEDRQKFIDHILKGCDQLDSLYVYFQTISTDETKLDGKKKLISSIISSIDTLSFHYPEKYSHFATGKEIPNNAWFYGYIQYRQNLDCFEKECDGLFRSDIRQYLDYLKKKAGNNVSD